VVDVAAAPIDARMNEAVGRLASPDRMRPAMYRSWRLPWSASILRKRVSLDAFMAGSDAGD
jgi:hypothetical protein